MCLSNDSRSFIVWCVWKLTIRRETINAFGKGSRLCHSVCPFYFHHFITFKYHSSWFGRNLWTFWNYCIPGWLMTFRLMFGLGRRPGARIIYPKNVHANSFWATTWVNANRRDIVRNDWSEPYVRKLVSLRLGECAREYETEQNECFIIQRFNPNNNNFRFNSLTDAQLNAPHTYTPNLTYKNKCEFNILLAILLHSPLKWVHSWFMQWKFGECVCECRGLWAK